MDVQMLPVFTTAASVVPSALDAMPPHFLAAPTLVTSVHVAPELVDVQMPPGYTVAASFVPSALDAIPFQALAAPTLVSSVHVAPELVDVQMLPSYTTVASFVPSSLDVMPDQPLVAPTLVSSIQFAPTTAKEATSQVRSIEARAGGGGAGCKGETTPFDFGATITERRLGVDRVPCTSLARVP